MPFIPSNYSSPHDDTDLHPTHRLQDPSWIPILHHDCDFGPSVFEKVTINLIRNPNINSSHLFRADILYDSLGQYTNIQWPVGDVDRLLGESALKDDAFPGFRLERTFIRQMIPRNPQLDKPVAQTCHILRCLDSSSVEHSLVLYIPHVTHLEELPWYHPAVQSLAYLHTWHPEGAACHSKPDSAVSLGPDIHRGFLSIHYKLFDSQALPLPSRVLRTAHHLLATLYKHGQGSNTGYTKRGQHDQLISQQRVQDTYTELKREHAKRLCDNWVEQTEPTKHVFEDLGIAAFLIELWRDMYQLPPGAKAFGHDFTMSNLPKFPGFVDIGCGNGVLVEILLLSGYRGWGFDARRRKTWRMLSPQTQESLHELVLIPQPLFEFPAQPPPATSKILLRLLSTIFPSKGLLGHHDFPSEAWHNGIFPRSTFIISNHADELTPWTPLLASISHSPFLAIPCCSHNLSGLRFRAPSVFNSLSADNHAPTYFAKDIKRSKSVAIAIHDPAEEEEDEACDHHQDPPYPFPDFKPVSASTFESGDLKVLSPSARAKQPSAYSSLCDWVSHLASSVDYVVEREMLRIPSTRNIGIVGRSWAGEMGSSGDERERIERVVRIAKGEGADGKAWVERCAGLKSGRGVGSVAH